MRSVLTLTLVGALLCVSVVILGATSTSPVADEAMRGDHDAVRGLLQKGADVNAAQNDGMTALHWAAQRGDAELAQMLIYAGARADAVTRIGLYTPLHVAAREGHAAVAKVLLDNGANVDAKTTNSGVTPLHLAAASGNVELISLLLDHKADVNARESEWDQTPLIFAASLNRVAAIKVLLKRGADPSLTTKVLDLTFEGKLAAAAKDRAQKAVDAFEADKDKKIEQELNPSQVQAAALAGREVYESRVLPKVDPNAAPTGRGGRGGRGGANGDDGTLPPIATKGGMTALLHAARQGYVESVIALIEGGADINQVCAGDKTSPLLIAIINGEYDTAMELIKRGANPNLAASINGVAPLWAVVNAEWQPRTRFPQPEEQSLQKATYLDVMTALLDAGANPDARLTQHPWYMVYTGCGNQNCGLEDTEGSTPFWRAAYATDVPAMRLLVSRGADPKIPTKAPPPRGPRSGTPLEKIEADAARPIQPVAPGLWPATDASTLDPDPSGLPPVPAGGPGVFPIHAASGVGYGEGFAGNAHRHAPDAWLASVKFLVEELGADVNARDYNGYTPLHHAAARGDNELIMYLVSKGADVKAVARTGQTVADMANGPVQRVSPFPETVALLEKLGSKNNHKCVTC
jgi:ankyrin repeat protein